MPTLDVAKARSLGYSTDEIQQFMKSRGLTEKKTIGGFFKNVGDSAEDVVTGLANTVLHPIDTAKSLYGLGSGIVQLAIPGEQGNEELARQVGQFYADRYGSLDKAYESFYKDPVGVAMDASTVLGIGASGAKLAGLGKTSKALGTASKVTDPLSVVGSTGKLFGRGRKKLAGSLASESENILTRGMGNPMTLKKAKGVSPVSMNKLFSKYNLYDRSPEAFQAGFKQANTQAKGLLKSAPTSIKTTDILKLLDDEIAKLSSKAKTSTKSRLAMEELMGRKQMFLEGIQNPNVSTPLINDASKVYDIKSAFQGDLPPSSFGMPSGEIGKNLGVKKAYQTLLTGVENKAPGIKNLGREQSALLKLKDIATSQQARGAAKQNINFSRMGGAGVGGILGGIPGAVGGYVAERVANSPQFLGGTSKALQMGSNALNKGMKIPEAVRKFGNTGYGGVKASRLLTAGVPSQDKPSRKVKSTKVQTYKPSISQPKNVFKNRSAFGSKFKLKARN